MTLSGSTDYLQWDANSLKDLIVEKLKENGNFTDQIFEDSNLSVLIDVFAYMFDILTYMINNSASEAIFSDSQLYENINRIVKMLGYNPRGFITSKCESEILIKTGQTLSGLLTIPKYTTCTTDLSDTNGNPIKFTFIDDFPIFINDSNEVEVTSNPILYNGWWNLYDVVFLSTGNISESFILSNLDLTTSDKIYLSHNNIDIYIESTEGVITRYYGVNDISEYDNNSEVFEIRINENKQYVLTFGDGVRGKRLSQGDKIYVLYLQSNGIDGEIGENIINVESDINVEVQGLSEDFIKRNILKLYENPDNTYITFGNVSTPQIEKIYINNIEKSAIIQDFETVESIRTNAPINFRTGNRLITKNDFSNYLLSNYSNQIYDIKIMNNWEYMTTFLKWLFDNDSLTSDIEFYKYLFTDSCDFNNIYMWAKSFTNSNIATSTKRVAINDMNKLKCVTSELLFQDPLLVNFTPYISGDYDITNFDPNNENIIQIIKDDNILISNDKIKQNVANTIINFFLLTNNELGQEINLSSLYNSLVNLNGVKEVRTKYLQSGAVNESAIYFNGLSFALWTPFLISGKDFKTISGTYKLNNFQFPVLLNSNTFINKIEVVGDPYLLTDIEY